MAWQVPEVRESSVRCSQLDLGCRAGVGANWLNPAWARTARLGLESVVIPGISRTLLIWGRLRTVYIVLRFPFRKEVTKQPFWSILDAYIRVI